jgi:glycosyltransferase involved in cell wall biosynthesis
MIAGAAFVDSVVFRMTEHLKKDSRYSFHGFGFETHRIRPGHASTGAIYETHEPYPGVNGKFSLRPGLFRVIPDAIATTFSRDPKLPRSWSRRFGEYTLEWRYAAVKQALERFDIYHWHCFDPWRLHLMRLLPANARLIVTLWGSDLFRTSGVHEYARQLFVTHRATAFTMASPEMREVFLSKFGRELYSRVHLLNYGACNLPLVRHSRQHRSTFLAGHGIAEDKIVICAGNNGSQANRHVEILNAIAALPLEIQHRVAVIVPMTYIQTPPSYVAEVRHAASRLPAPVVILDRYLEAEDVARLRGACDITIHVPVSDQMSAAMAEALYAGSVLITGAWLPYSMLRKHGLYYHAIESLDELSGRLAAVIDGIAEERKRAAEASSRIYGLMAWESVIPRWLNLYDEVYSQGRQ